MHRVAALALLLGACSDDSAPVDGGSGDTGSDAATADAGEDAAPREDGGEATGDSGADVNIDAGIDVGIDSGPMDMRPSSERHTAVPTADGVNGYWEYLPPDYGDGVDRPLLVFWHGLGENGNGASELDRVVRHGPPRLIERDEWPNDRPFIVLSAQHSGGGCPSSNEIRDFIAHALATYDIDETRVYLTGLSCGAIGSWGYLGNNIADTPVAAAVLIAGDGRGAAGRAGCDLAQLPIWAFHSRGDGVVDSVGTIETMNTLMACDPHADLRVNIYEDGAHDSWTRTYDPTHAMSEGHDIYAWLLTHTRE